VKVTAHLSLVPRLSMYGSIPPVLNAVINSLNTGGSETNLSEF
jgi:hypothetical protein